MRADAVDVATVLRLQNRGMIVFDLVLGSGALLAPRATLTVLGHAEPSADAEDLFRRCGPVWLTFAAAHALADRRGRAEDWWALAWLRGTEIATDVVWSRSAAFTARGRAGMIIAGAANVTMTAGFAWMAARARGRG